MFPLTSRSAGFATSLALGLVLTSLPAAAQAPKTPADSPAAVPAPGNPIDSTQMIERSGRRTSSRDQSGRWTPARARCR